MESFGPRPTGKPPEEVTLVGKMIPMDEIDQPIFLRIGKGEDYFMPLFSSSEGLSAFMADVLIRVSNVRRIYDGAEFLSGLPVAYRGARLRVILDPRFTPEKTIRFLELQLD
jgi:hypothetical protein